MDILTVIKVKPKPDGHWFQNSKWDILRAMRESVDFTIVVKDKGEIQMLEKADIIGKIISIKGHTFMMRPNGIVTRFHIDVTT